MGAAASQCVQTCCGCCWGDGKASTTRMSDASTVQQEKDGWFEHDKVPLLSAHDATAMLDEGITVRKVMAMRSPRHADPVKSTSRKSEASSSPSRRRVESRPPKRGLRAMDNSPLPSPHKTWGEEHEDNSPNSDESWEMASPERGRKGESSPVRSPRFHLSRGNEDEDRKSATLLEASRSPNRKAEHKHHRSHRSVSAVSQESSEAFDDDGDANGSPRSPRAPNNSSSGPSSPKRKPRYGRKNYRADSNRQKSL